MTPELNVLLLSVALGLIYLIVHAMLLRGQIGYDDVNRDHDPEPNLLAGRGIRAMRNFLETYPFFVALVLATWMSGHFTAIGHAGAWLWLVARALYLPAYVLGIGRLRSAIWLASLVGLAMMMAGAYGY